MDSVRRGFPERGVKIGRATDLGRLFGREGSSTSRASAWEEPRPQPRPVCMEARVWIGTKGRFNPLQTFEQRMVSLDGDVLTFRGGGDTVAASLSEVEFGFPRSMTGAGFVMTLRGVKSYVWFYDPFAGRSTLLKSGNKEKAQIDGAMSWFKGRRAAKPWLKALRSPTR